jgi:hypothetical protein
MGRWPLAGRHGVRPATVMARMDVQLSRTSMQGLEFRHPVGFGVMVNLV